MESRSPIGAHASVQGDLVTLHAMLADEAMTRVRCVTRTVPAAGALTAAATLAEELLRSLSGAAPLVE
ncbi:MAG: hypothetical protein QJR03_03090 [Sphaerobacter sp.]|nr:hypothetical protein [Sphaerobacter sp.]